MIKKVKTFQGRSFSDLEEEKINGWKRTVGDTHKEQEFKNHPFLTRLKSHVS